MRFRLSNYEKYAYGVLDVILLNIALGAVFFFQFGEIAPIFKPDYVYVFSFASVVWLLALVFVNSKVDHRRMQNSKVLWDFIYSFLLNVMLTLSFLAVMRLEFSRQFLFIGYITFFIVGAVFRFLVRSYLQKFRVKGHNFRRIVVAGIDNFSIEFVKEVEVCKEYGYKFLGFFGEPNERTKVQPEGDLDTMYNYLIENNVDEVYVSLPSVSHYHTKALVKFCHLNFIKVHFLNEVIHKLSKRSVYLNVDYNGVTPVVSLVKEPLEVRFNRVAKRMFDILFSTLFILLVFPWLLPIIALLIKLESPGPVFFKQKRSGILSKPFYCYKFRTMRVNDQADVQQAAEGDARITWIGSFLRRTSIDEFPQFFNVLIGNMSVVGPRPHMIEHTKMYSKLIKPFVIRHWVKPGITGLAQTRGYRGETKEVKQMQDRVKMDIFYIQNWSMFMDARIILTTCRDMIALKNMGF